MKTLTNFINEASEEKKLQAAADNIEVSQDNNMKTFAELKPGDIVYELSFAAQEFVYYKNNIRGGWDYGEKEVKRQYEARVDIIQYKFEELHENKPWSEWEIKFTPIPKNKKNAKSGLNFSTSHSKNDKFPDSVYIGDYDVQDKGNYITIYFSDKNAMIKFLNERKNNIIKGLQDKIDLINTNVEKALSKLK